MNVPKTPDHKLIGALRIRATDSPPADTLRPNVSPASIVPVALLNEVADRLAELTQPQPIETAPRDGTYVRLQIGKSFFVTGCWLTDTDDDEDGQWCYACEEGEDVYHIKTHPTHWLPCVKVDPASLGGQADG
jgi:hypothetical protein